MIKNIFGKLITTTLAILLLSFIIAGLLMYGFLGEYAVADKENTLREYTYRVVQLAEYLVENNNPIVQHIFSINIEAYSQNSNSNIFVTDVNGQIILTSSSKLKKYVGKYIEPGFVQQLKKGQELRSIGNFNNYFDEQYLTIGYPIRYNGNIIGGVYMNTPVPELQRLRTEVYRLFLNAISLSMVFAAAAIYIMSRRISNPLREIGKVAQKIACGDFSARVKIRNDDEIGELGRTINYMADALNNLEQMRRSFIANVSHELRTPMTSIIGFAEGMIDGTIPLEKHQQYLTIVKNETVRVTRLVNDLLDLARMEAGEDSLKVINFDICELIRRNILKFEPQINNKNLNISISFSQESQLVTADPDAIERVITNLMDNAIKFTPEGGKIEIITEKENEFVKISIKDNGIGIDKDELPYIWERFYKADKSRSRDKTGTGLGLAIIKNIIRMHGQNIWVKSEKEKGSIFTFTLQDAGQEL